MNSLCACPREKKIMGLSDFSVLAQIWAVGPNVKGKVITFSMQIKKNYTIVSIVMMVV